MKKPLVSVYGAGLGIPKKKSLYMIQIRPHGVLRSSFRLVLLSDPEKAKLKDAMRCIQVGSLSQLKEFSILAQSRRCLMMLISSLQTSPQPSIKPVTTPNKAMAIYDKHGKTIITESIQIDDDCYFGDKVIKVRALVKGESSPRLFYVSDLLADDGKKEINNIIAASLDKQ